MISKIIFAVSIIFYLMLFVTSSTVPNSIRGSDLTQYNPRNRAYIVGVIDASRIVDLKGTYICDWSADHDQTDDEIVLTIIDIIKKNPLLQTQPAAPAVLYAYKQSYCLSPPDT